MGLFGKKKEEKSCCCGSSCTPEAMAQAETAKKSAGVKVLGSGCAKCHALEDATRKALEELGMDSTIDHVTDFAQLAAYGVMTTPALVVDGKVVSYLLPFSAWLYSLSLAFRRYFPHSFSPCPVPARRRIAHALYISCRWYAGYGDSFVCWNGTFCSQRS